MQSCTLTCFVIFSQHDQHYLAVSSEISKVISISYSFAVMLGFPYGDSLIGSMTQDFHGE